VHGPSSARSVDLTDKIMPFLVVLRIVVVCCSMATLSLLCLGCWVGGDSVTEVAASDLVGGAYSAGSGMRGCWPSSLAVWAARRRRELVVVCDLFTTPSSCLFLFELWDETREKSLAVDGHNGDGTCGHRFPS
jgi:hypothetical protein